MKQLKRVVGLVFAVALIGVTCAMQMKANIGVGPYDANIRLFSELTLVQIGTVSIVINSSCVLIELVLLKKKFNLLHLAQVPISIFLGVVINFAYYNLLEQLVITSYVGNLILFIVGVLGCSFAVGIVMVLDVITMPCEGACTVVGDLIGVKFHVIRQLVDVVLVIFVLVMCYICNIEMILREGTIISALIFGPSMGIFMVYQKKVMKKLGLLK